MALKTDELIDRLGQDLRPVRAGPPAWLALAAIPGAAMGLLAVILYLRFRWDLAEAVATPFFWAKTGYTVALAIAGFWVGERLARPVGSPRGGLILAAGVFAAMLVLAVVQSAGASPEMAHHMLMGHSWTYCSTAVFLFALPVLVGGLLAMRLQAPTRPMLAGAAVGLFAGAVGGTLYGLSCMETTAAFVVAWYTLGMAGSTALGAVLGRFVLRW